MLLLQNSNTIHWQCSDDMFHCVISAIHLNSNVTHSVHSGPRGGGTYPGAEWSGGQCSEP